jgi:hypothetical protein
VKSPLGDFYRAAEKLRLTGDDVAGVAALLELETRAVTAVALPSTLPLLTGGGVIEVIDERPPALGTRPPALLAKAVSLGTPAAPESQPAWFTSTTPFPVEKTRHRGAKLPFDPLLAPNGARNIVAAIAATTVPEGEMDLERIVVRVARRELVVELHRRGNITVRNGVQLLVDRSETMSLFARDASWMEEQLVHVVGADRVQSLRFDGIPQRGAGRRGEEWGPYRPPIAGVPVLVLTDLASSASEWASFAETVRAAGCPLVALVPYPPNRWPAVPLTIVHWDRSLDARRAGMTMRRAQKVLR